MSDPTAIDVEANIPEIRIKAKRPPIKPPFNLSKLDFIRRINRKSVVALSELNLIKAKGANGLSNIKLNLILYMFFNFKKNLLKLFN